MISCSPCLITSQNFRKKLEVKIDILNEFVLQKVIDAPNNGNDTEFDPEVQLRGFLQTFEDTLLSRPNSTFWTM